MIPYIERQLANTKRVDVIWDHYLPDILKATTRQRRGTGIRQRMRHDGNGNFPRNWNSYLQNASNKVKLFGYLSVAIAQTVFCEGKVVISTLDEDVLGCPLPGADESECPLRPCNHGEFDTKVMLHAANAVSHGYKGILIIANDTDIIVLGISFFSDIGAGKLWVSFGIGNKLRNISIHDICSTMSSAKAKALPAFNALTESDKTSFFSGTLHCSRNLLTQNGARGQSSQPLFVVRWISQKHLLQMTSLSSRASSFLCIRFLVL